MSNNTIPAAPSTITSGYAYRGFRYEPGEDREDDNIKIWHDVVEESTGLNTDMLLHFSPYKTPTEEQFKAAVDEYITNHPPKIVLPKPGNVHTYYWCSLTGPKGNEIVGEPMIVRVRADGYVEFTELMNSKREKPFIGRVTEADFLRFSQTAAGAKVLAYRIIEQGAKQ